MKGSITHMANASGHYLSEFYPPLTAPLLMMSNMAECEKKQEKMQILKKQLARNKKIQFLGILFHIMNEEIEIEL